LAISEDLYHTVMWNTTFEPAAYLFCYR